MKNINYKLLSILLGICLLGTAAVAYSFYRESQLYKINREEFAEFQKQKELQQTQLQKLLEDNEKLMRDITEISNLEKKLRRAIIRDTEAGKLGSNLSAETNASPAPASGYTPKGGSKREMTGLAAMSALTAQNQNINLKIMETKKSVSALLGEMEGRSGALASFPNKWPTEEGPITSSYGERTDPIASGMEWHSGIDIAVDFGTPVYASGAGTVEQAGWNGGYGRYISIEHGNGYKTAYAHMSGLAVSAGQKVAKGEIIGFVGSTGYSTGPHLHFEVSSDGQPIDPYFVLQR